MRRSILFVALLVLMSFPSVEAFAATETIVEKGEKLLDSAPNEQRLMYEENNLSVQVYNPAAGSVEGNLIETDQDSRDATTDEDSSSQGPSDTEE